ncbi:MAG TPA: GNAT family N-acetyltransferase [Longimicrobiales bacterium]|nr:GNAT family N-acetyltransferase [Longimicrobiales bacterium]
MNTKPDSDGFSLRDASPEDIPALSQLHVQAFQETHGDGPTIALREQQWRTKFDSGQLLFCIVIENEARKLIGFASGELHKDEQREFDGELNKIYLLREYHRRGLGRQLLCAAANRFKEQGINSMLLFGDAKSPTNGFYEAMGGQRLYGSNGKFHGSYGWADLGREPINSSGSPQVNA